MINNIIIEDFLNCKYKSFLKLSGKSGIKHDYELMREEILKEYKPKFKKIILERYGERSIIEDFNFNRKIKNGTFYSFDIYHRDSLFDISLDAIEIKNRKFIPILLVTDNKIHKKDKILLVLQCLILSKFIGLNFENARLFYGIEFKTLKIKVNSYFEEANKILEELIKVYTNEEPKICKNDYCKICEFESYCYDRLKEKDDLSLLSSIREKERPRFERKGIFTVNQLSYTFKPRKKSEWVKRKEHPFHHSLQALAIREKKVYIYDEVKLPNTKTKIFVDLEGNSDGSFIYLIGLLIKNESDEKYYHFWANDKEHEKEIFKKFAELVEKNHESTLFYYGKYDKKVFKRIFSSSRNRNIKDLVLNNSIDVLKNIRRNIYFPTYSNSLKEIASFLGFSWSSKNSSGLQSIVWRWKWENIQDDKIKEDLIQYNKDDCVALSRVVEFINHIFNKSEKNDFIDNKVSVVESPQEDENSHFKNMTYATKDIEVITKGAYFEYQRNKIFFRTNENLRKIKKKYCKKSIDRFRINEKIIILDKKCPFCKEMDIIINESKIYKKICFDLKFFKFGIKRWNTLYMSYRHKCKKCKKHFVPLKFKKIYLNSRKDYNKNYKRVWNIQKGYGHNFLSYVIHQNIVDETAYRHIDKNLNDYFNFVVGPQHLWWLKIIASRYYKETYQNIINKLKNGNLIHADETKAKMKTN